MNVDDEHYLGGMFPLLLHKPFALVDNLAWRKATLKIDLCTSPDNITHFPVHDWKDFESEGHLPCCASGFRFDFVWRRLCWQIGWLLPIDFYFVFTLTFCLLQVCSWLLDQQQIPLVPGPVNPVRIRRNNGHGQPSHDPPQRVHKRLHLSVMKALTLSLCLKVGVYPEKLGLLLWIKILGKLCSSKYPWVLKYMRVFHSSFDPDCGLPDLCQIVASNAHP